LVEALQVPQLLTKSGLKNINTLYEEAHTSQKKKLYFFLATTEHIWERFRQENNQN
jgi:hypothetical protein